MLCVDSENQSLRFMRAQIVLSGGVPLADAIDLGQQ
jgi:hypothetical protein